MADWNSIERVPDAISGRYGPQETLSHEVIRQTGNVLLWKTTRLPEAAPKVEEFHVTNGNKAVHSLIPDMDEAIVNFEIFSAKQGAANV